MFLDDTRRLWVEVGASDTLTTYDVFDRDGAYAGTAQTRLPVLDWVRPIVIGDRFYAVVTDDLDVAYVVRARLVPAG